MNLDSRPNAIPRRTLAAVTLAATTTVLAACAPDGPDTQRMPRDVSPCVAAVPATQWVGWGTLLAGVLLVIAVGIWHDGTEVPGHRSSTGPAAAAARAHRAAHHAAAVAVMGPALAALLWAPVTGKARLLLLLVAAGIAVAAGTVARHHSTVAAGADLADLRWQREAAEAERAGQPTPEEPVVGTADLRRLGETRGFERPDGSAAAVLLDVAGRDRPLRATWARVAQSQGMGRTDENGTFHSWAQIDEVRVDAAGDVTVWWRLTELGRTAGSMSGCKSVLQHELRVREMSSFETEFATGRVFARFSNGTTAPTSKTERPAPPRPTAPSDPADSVWDL